MKRSIAFIVVALVAVIVGRLWAQSYGSITFGPIAPAVTNCPAGSASQATLCAVGTTLYVSYNAGSYQPLVSSNVQPPTFTAPAGQCITGYNATTNTWVTGACIATVTKAQVLATGLSATTTLQ